jgi:hypothetical protein
MPRRLEHRDRVRELGDAPVPFLYDAHALFFSDDVITLEKNLEFDEDRPTVRTGWPRSSPRCRASAPAPE